MVTKDQVARQFGRQAREYAISAGHAAGPDLAILLTLLRPATHMRVLDVATGAGHTAAAVAPFVNSVVATDLAPEMVAETEKLIAARNLANVTAQVADVEALPFPDGEFDAVTCRIAPHHFTNINRAVAEISRVLKPGGVFAFEDNVSPASPSLDRFINELERLRDPTHVRSYSKKEWRELLAANRLVLKLLRNYRKTHQAADWIARSGQTPEADARVYRAFAEASPRARAHFRITYNGDRLVSFTDDKIIVRAVKSA